MSTFISVTTDPFAEVRQGAREQTPAPPVRRPLRGIQIKEDTYAVLRAMTTTGTELPLFDSGSPQEHPNGGSIGRSMGGNSNFLIQTIQESRMEKQQIVETFGEDYIFFFGERPRFLQVQGVLLNTADFNWKTEFWENYDRYLRGTKLVEQNARLYFYFDDVVVEGYLTGAATTHKVASPYHMPFNFQLYVTNYAALSSVGSTLFQDSTADTAIPSGGLVAPDAASQKLAAEKAARSGAQGGLSSFLASTAAYAQNATFSIQNSLENIRNTFFSSTLVVPVGLGTGVSLRPISNQASFSPARTGQPIYEMNDEYIGAAIPKPKLDEAELKRVAAEQTLRSPLALEAMARSILTLYGVDTTRREPGALLLGRGAFKGQEGFGSFGIRQADGALDVEAGDAAVAA